MRKRIGTKKNGDVKASNIAVAHNQDRTLLFLLPTRVKKSQDRNRYEIALIATQCSLGSTLSFFVSLDSYTFRAMSVRH